MNEPLPTLLLIYLCPDHGEEAYYHIDETLTSARIGYRLIALSVERVSLENATPFVVTHLESAWYSCCLRRLIQRPLRIWRNWWRQDLYSTSSSRARSCWAAKLE